MTLIQAYEYHLKNLEKLSGIDFAVTTVKKYGYTLNSLKRFLKTQYGITDIRLRDLDHKFIESYHTYLRTSEKLMHNSAAKSVKHLNRIINISIKTTRIIIQ